MNYPQKLSLEGRVAVVSGAARGIGRAGALALARAGATVCGCDIAGPVADSLEVAPASEADLAETGRAVEGAGGRWSAHLVDQRDIGQALRLAAVIVVADGGLMKKTPLGVPWVEPEDVAPPVAFLASDAARMVSGTSLAATGGDSAHVTA